MKGLLLQGIFLKPMTKITEYIAPMELIRVDYSNITKMLLLQSIILKFNDKK